MRVELAGKVDASFELKFEGQLEDDDRFWVFDLGALGRINSAGVQQWVSFVESIDCEYFCFTRCRPPFVDQINMVWNFVGDGEIVSCHLPFRCKSCGTDFTELLDLRTDFERISNSNLSTLECPNCGGTASFDGILEVYLERILEQGVPSVPDPCDRVLDDAGSRA
ncbi:MAG: hypothetical protein ABEN55_08195 [Bradymonadaceae bacterium]